MNRITDQIRNINYNYIRRKIFRREVEASFYSNKPVNLPRITKITVDNVTDYKKRYPVKYFSDEAEQREIKELMLRLENGNQIISAADKILGNKVNIMNSGEINLGEEINWNKDYKTNYEWPVEPGWRCDFYNFPKGVDIQYPWELARFHQAMNLGKAFALTGEEKYLNKYLNLINDFDKKNPLGTGVNWLNPSEASIRLLNVIVSFPFFISSSKISAKEINMIVDFILKHTLFIENNLNYSSKRDHNYLINLLALGLAGLVIKETGFGKKNLYFAKYSLEEEIRTQIYEDGVFKGQSIPFHSIALEVFYLAKIFLDGEGKPFTKEFNDKLLRMFRVLAAYTRSDLSVPLIGDIPASRIVPFNSDGSKPMFFYPLPIGAYIFNDGMLKSFAQNGTAELIFLFGKSGYDEYLKMETEAPENVSTGFTKGGHYLIKDDDVHVFIEAGEIGKCGQGSPGHNDTFTFELFYKGKLLITDTGMFSFFADKELRNNQRSVKCHNSVFIDDELLSEFEDLFKIKEDLTNPKLLEWKYDNSEVVLSVQHFAYTRFVDPVICMRTFQFDRQARRLNITDELLGGTNHRATLNLNLHPDVLIEQIEKTRFVVKNSDAKAELNFTVQSKEFNIKINDSFYSPGYGKLIPSKKITLNLKDKFPTSIITGINLL